MKAVRKSRRKSKKMQLNAKKKQLKRQHKPNRYKQQNPNNYRQKYFKNPNKQSQPNPNQQHKSPNLPKPQLQTHFPTPQAAACQSKGSNPPNNNPKTKNNGASSKVPTSQCPQVLQSQPTENSSTPMAHAPTNSYLFGMVSATPTICMILLRSDCKFSLAPFGQPRR